MTDTTKDVTKNVEQKAEESDDEEAPGLVKGTPENDDAHDDGRAETRMEKKSRKAMAKMGLKPFPGCTRVVMKRNKTTSFTINSPDVFVSKNTYVIFGEAKMDTMGSKEQELLKAFEAAKVGMEKAPVVAEEDEEEVDAEGVAEKDIEVVMNQVSASRAKVIKALKANNNDVVQTIMDLNE
ncbi:Nascent polypeptide-associated complex subunit alpha-like protein [Diplonema papillatum]|nr:Nascent polypeptide-associated complex subunit alpha-like protein [Diplonema papillatum]|eukprot:gene12059-18634_t